MQRQALGLSEKVLGKEHPSTLTSMNNLTLVLKDQGKFEEAEATQREALGLAEKGLGKEYLNLNRGYFIQWSAINSGDKSTGRRHLKLSWPRQVSLVAFGAPTYP